MGTKICSKCKRELTIDNFAKGNGKDGFSYWCKICTRQSNQEYNRQYRQDNKVTIAEYGKQYKRDNKEVVAEQMKQWHFDNKVAVAKRNKQWRQDNKEIIAEKTKQYQQDIKEHLTKYRKQYRQEHLEICVKYGKQYRQDNKEEFRMHKQRRRARERLLPHTLTVLQWESIKEHFNNKCVYCGQTEKLTIEHFVPVSKFGELTINNIIPVCSSCNSSKGNRLFSVWYPMQPYYNKKREQKILKFLNCKDGNQQLTLTI